MHNPFLAICGDRPGVPQGRRQGCATVALVRRSAARLAPPGPCPLPVTDPAFDRVRAELRRSVSDTNWRLWLDKLALRELGDDVLVLEAPDNVRGWVRDRFGRRLQRCAESVLGPDVRVELVAPGSDPPPVAAGGGSRSRRAQDAAPDPRMAFDQFVIGAGNQMAHAAALAVAELPGLAYNPLFLYGRPGLGKTHLLRAIGGYVERHGGGTVRYTTAEAFTTHFTGALRAKAIDAFKAEYRDVDVLLVDDVQFLQAKARTEEEFFHTFNALHETGAQIVLTSDRPPQDLDGTDERLRARYAAGLVVSLEPPDLPTRRTILRKSVAQDALTAVEDAAVELIARRVESNVRALQGALIRVVAFASLTGRPATVELATEVLAGLYPDLPAPAPSGPPTIEAIQDAVCAALHVSREALVSTARTADVTWARHVAMFLARELTQASTPKIGGAFGREHTTVLNACRKTTARIEADPESAALVHRLRTELAG